MSTSTIAESIQGALMLARFDRRGLGAFDGSNASARASFNVAWFIIGLYAISAILISATVVDGAQTMSEVASAEIGSEVEAPPSDLLIRFGAVMVLAQIVGWLTLLSFMYGFLGKGGLQHRYATAVAAYNWTLLWRRAVELLPIMMGVAGLGGSIGLIYLAVSAYSIYYLYFTLKAALEEHGFEAAMIVLAEIGLNLVMPAAALLALSLAYFGTSDVQQLFEALPRTGMDVGPGVPSMLDDPGQSGTGN
ncbi:MAG: hypothetical protein KI792_11805 [Alphaproteobacteria bacterium]|nr:hypothetical protein [Alphaproteobacteria bacterium SS10]